MRRLTLISLALITVLAAACTKSVKEIVTTSTTIVTTTADQRPISAGPTTAATAQHCPLLDRQTAANRIGMRLERITVLRSGGAVVGCRIYALQGSPLSASEHLPPANQPVIEIRLVHYRNTIASNNAIVRAADAGANPQQAPINGTTAVCFQTAFYRKDRGRDWACAWAKGTLFVIVRTVVVKPAYNAIQVARAVRLP